VKNGDSKGREDSEVKKDGDSEVQFRGSKVFSI